MDNGTVPAHRIEIRIQELSQLFNSMDPTPFHHKDLDPDAEEFLVSWAQEHPHEAELEILIHLAGQAPQGGEAMVREAMANYFSYRAGHTRREFRQLMQRGRRSLVIGLGFLAACLLAAEQIGRFGGGTFISILRESVIIGGWVAMWRPLEIFLYDWWPLTRRQAMFEKLARAKVSIAAAPAS
jgi:hypothetical protein